MKEIEKIKKIYYVYYSYEQFGRGYIGYRKCPEGLTPETDNYLGSFRDKGFKPTEKIILFQDLTKLEAMEIEIKLHAFYNVKDNPNFANKSNAIAIGFNFSASGENNPNYGKKCYNNGINNRYFSPNEEIPEGYIKGDKEETCKKKSEAKKGENNSNYGKIIINNGIKEIRISPNEEIPEGFIIGRKEETRQKRKGQKHSGETKKKQSEAMKSINSKKKIRVITSLCCYFSVKDAMKELGISNTKFYKLFEKDSHTGYYIGKEKV